MRVQQLLALIAARLGLVDLVLARIGARLAAIDLRLAVRDVDRPGEVRGIDAGPLAVELGLLALDLALVAVRKRLLAVGDALVEIRQRLLLLESALPCDALRRSRVIVHVLSLLSMPVSPRGPGRAMW